LIFVIRKAFKFYLRPTPEQARNLDRIRLACCELYNAGLQEKRDAWRKQHVGLGRAAQQAELTDVKQVRPDVAAIHAQVLQDVFSRLHRAFAAFFRRLKNGECPGYPRFRSARRFTSFTFPQVSRGDSLHGGGVVREGPRLRIHGVPGSVKVKWHRPLEGLPKTATFKREGKRWYVIFSCDGVPVEVLPKTGRECGLDLGLTTFATLDDSTTIANPRFLHHAQGAVRRAQRRVSRRPTKRSNRRRKAVALLASHLRHVANARRDHAHKIARTLITNYDRIAVEKLNIRGLARGILSKSVHDVGWGIFLTILKSKAANAGREVVEVDPAGTTQECFGCGIVVRKTLKEREHRCGNCGLTIGRDVNAARNIRARAFGPGSGLRRGQPEVRASNDPRSRRL
jgi:putative transposase